MRKKQDANVVRSQDFVVGIKGVRPQIRTEMNEDLKENMSLFKSHSNYFSKEESV